jgi:predicted nucleic acid-binding protein
VKIEVALKGVQNLCLDTAPLIYYTEKHPNYFDLMQAIFKHVQQSKINLNTSALTLTEVLMKPIQAQNQSLQTQYRNLLLNTQNLSTVTINSQIAIKAAELRAKYNLRTPDALQVATGINTACDAFLTNDKGLKRVTEIAILVLDELEV